MSKRSFLTAALALVSGGAFAQVSFTGSYSENFNGWPKEDDPGVEQGVEINWTNNVTKLGWYQALFNVNGNQWVFQDKLGIGVAGSLDRLTSIGSQLSPERALGTGNFGASNNNNFHSFWGLRLQNDSGGVIDSVDISLAVEHWRRTINGSGANSPAEVNITFGQYQVGGNDFLGTYTAAPGLDLVSQAPMIPGTAGGSLQDGNLPANRQLLATTLNGLNWNPGESLWIRWMDVDNRGRDATIAIDDLSIVGHAPVPEPTTALVLLPALAFLRKRRK